MIDIKIEDLDLLEDEEFEQIEKEIAKQLSVIEVSNLRGQAAIFHDDQHIGEKRRELKALKHPSFDVEGEMKFRSTAVVDSLEGNMLIHPLTTPVIEVNKENDLCRATWWSLGIMLRKKESGRFFPEPGSGRLKTNTMRDGSTT